MGKSVPYREARIATPVFNRLAMTHSGVFRIMKNPSGLSFRGRAATSESVRRWFGNCIEFEKSTKSVIPA